MSQTDTAHVMSRQSLHFLTHSHPSLAWITLTSFTVDYIVRVLEMQLCNSACAWLDPFPLLHRRCRKKWTKPKLPCKTHSSEASDYLHHWMAHHFLPLSNMSRFIVLSIRGSTCSVPSSTAVLVPVASALAWKNVFFFIQIPKKNYYIKRKMRLLWSSSESQSMSAHAKGLRLCW